MSLFNHEFSKGQSPSALIKSKHSSTGQSSKIHGSDRSLSEGLMMIYPKNTNMALVED